MIIETTDNRFYIVKDSPETPQCWIGIPVKRVKGQFVLKIQRRPELVRKEGSRVVQP